MLKVWNLSMVVGTFALTTFGTFLTRGSILSSVHAFAQSLVGPMYLGFLVLVPGGGLRADRRAGVAAALGGPLRRGPVAGVGVPGEQPAAAGQTLVVLLGHDLPAVHRGRRPADQSTVGGPYFRPDHRAPVPPAVVPVGVGPLLPWRRATRRTSSAGGHRPGEILGAVTVVVLAIGGLRNSPPSSAYGLAMFVLASNVEPTRTAIRGYRRATGAPPVPGSVRGAAARNRRFVRRIRGARGSGPRDRRITVSSSFARQTEVALDRGQRDVLRRVRPTTTVSEGPHQPQRTS